MCVFRRKLSGGAPAASNNIFVVGSGSGAGLAGEQPGDGCGGGLCQSKVDLETLPGAGDLGLGSSLSGGSYASLGSVRSLGGESSESGDSWGRDYFTRRWPFVSTIPDPRFDPEAQVGAGQAGPEAGGGAQSGAGRVYPTLSTFQGEQ